MVATPIYQILQSKRITMALLAVLIFAPRLLNLDAFLNVDGCAFWLARSLKFYKALESHYSDHNGIDESRYYAGQTYFQLEDYNLSLSIVNRIEHKSDFFPFGLYTIGLMNLKKKA